MLRERGDNDQQAIAHHEGDHSSSLWFRWLFFRRRLRQRRIEGLSANRLSFSFLNADNVPDSEAKTLSVNQDIRAQSLPISSGALVQLAEHMNGIA
jgi:hypothetical protein